MSTLFERIGGTPAVDAAVDNFYEKVLADERINSYFENLDMVAQARKQKAFLTMVFGGPSRYEGRDLRVGHVHLGLTDEHFDAVVENLGLTLKELGVSDDDIREVASIAEGTRSDVLNR